MYAIWLRKILFWCEKHNPIFEQHRCEIICRQVYRGLIKSSQQQFFAAIIICLVN